MSSFIFYPPSCWASTLIITNVHHFTVLRRRDSRVEEQTEDVWAKSACNSGLIIKASNSGRIIIARGHSKFWWYHRNFDQTCRRTDGFARGFAWWYHRNFDQTCRRTDGFARGFAHYVFLWPWSICPGFLDKVTVATNIVFLAFEQAVDHTNCVRRYWGKPDSSLQGGR